MEILIQHSQISFNSRPHTEVDRRRNEGGKAPHSFNSRPHTEVDLERMEKHYIHGYFQLTTSHGGRPDFSLKYFA